jgi:hypothetical protein
MPICGNNRSLLITGFHDCSLLMLILFLDPCTLWMWTILATFRRYILHLSSRQKFEPESWRIACVLWNVGNTTHSYTVQIPKSDSIPTSEFLHVKVNGKYSNHCTLENYWCYWQWRQCWCSVLSAISLFNHAVSTISCRARNLAKMDNRQNVRN